MLSFKKYLDPLFNKLDQISNFTNVNPKNPLEAEEYPYLENVVTRFTNDVNTRFTKLEHTEIELEDQLRVVDGETGDDKKDAGKVYNAILRKAEEIVERINRILGEIDSPYFGKIIFTRKNGKTTTSYLGKFGHLDPETKGMLITDWRSPIANLYYKNSGPQENVSFKSPVGIQKGNLTQKRMFEIDNSRFSNIYDTQSGNKAADQFLLSQLGKKIGQKLTDIVSTIQEQQNTIVREDINKTIVIQGVAGSGKTTIVLHRLAYLFFSDKEKVTPGNSLIIAPNKMFLDYISELLPNLGIQGVESNTYIFWAKKVLKLPDKYLLSKTLPPNAVADYKGSLKFIGDLEQFFEEYETDFLNGIPYSRRDLFSDAYFVIKDRHVDVSFAERVNLAMERIETSNKQLNGLVGGYISNSSLTPEVRTKIMKYVREGIKPLNVYKKFLKSRYSPANVAKHTLKTLRRNTGGTFNYELEDLSALVWLKFILQGNVEHMREYIVVDEAQDTNFLQLLTLFKVSKNGNLLLAGDLAQSIFPPFNIKNWAEVLELFKTYSPNLKSEYYQINKCYRTTSEIIDYANRTVGKLFEKHLKLPEAVLRHGQAVQTLKDNENFENIIKILEKDDSNTIAIIVKSAKDVESVFMKLVKNKKIKSKLIASDTDNYSTGISVIPVAKAKGLEFDSVYILDVNSDNYEEKDIDAKLLYVAMTRALHRLLIMYNEQAGPSKLIQNEIKE